MSLEEIYLKFQETSIKNFIYRKYLERVIKIKNLPFEIIESQKSIFMCLKAIECPDDETKIIKSVKDSPYLTIKSLQEDTKWSELRIRRTLEHLVSLGRCKKERSYRTGDRYYF